MDFEWQSTAPLDHTSPFAQLSRPQPFQSQSRSLKRTHSAFTTSPTKPPMLSEPNSQPYLFSTGGNGTIKPATAAAAMQGGRGGAMGNMNAFMTPRKVDIDFSSGGEGGMSSPECWGAEDTPEQVHGKVGTVAGLEVRKKGGISGMFGRFGESPLSTSTSTALTSATSTSTGTSGKGEIVARKYSNNASRRVEKRRRREMQKHLWTQNRGHGRRGSWEDSDDDESEDGADAGRDRRRTSGPGPASGSGAGTGKKEIYIPILTPIFTFVESHPTVPTILSYYAQFIMNAFILSGAIYMLYCFASAIRSDVDRASDEVAAEILADMNVCAKSFVENRCAAGFEVPPALRPACESWERCMNRDPKSVGRAKVSARTFAEILNGFVEPISYKALVGSFLFFHHLDDLPSDGPTDSEINVQIFSVVILTTAITIANYTFALFRNKGLNPHTAPPPYPHQQQQYHQHPHQTPAPQQQWPAHTQQQQSMFAQYGQGVYSIGNGSYDSYDRGMMGLGQVPRLMAGDAGNSNGNGKERERSPSPVRRRILS